MDLRQLVLFHAHWHFIILLKINLSIDCVQIELVAFYKLFSLLIRLASIPRNVGIALKYIHLEIFLDIILVVHHLEKCLLFKAFDTQQ